MNDHVLVWWVAVGAFPDDMMVDAMAVLDAEEHARADRFRFGKDRDLFVAAHVLARVMLARSTGLLAQAIRFSISSLGKPEIIGLPPGATSRHFSLSHTDGLVCCCVTADADVGIDVERVGRTKVGGIAERFFASGEVAWLRAQPEQEKPDAFFRLWTLKEAYLKAVGLGLNLPLDAFQLSAEPPGLIKGHDEDGRAWQFMQMRPAQHHILAVSCRTMTRTPLVFETREVGVRQLGKMIGSRMPEAIEA